MESDTANDIHIGVLGGIGISGLGAGLLLQIWVLALASLVTVLIFLLGYWWKTTDKEEKIVEILADPPQIDWTMASILIIGLMLNLTVASFYTAPHDFNNYLEGAQKLINGEQLYGAATQTGEVWFYGPLWAVIISAISFISTHYFALKLPAVLANTLILIPIYRLLEHYGRDAKTGTVFFMFSYVTLFNTLIGNDDAIMMFLLVSAIVFLLEKRYTLSVVTYTLSLGFKIIPIVILPAILLYLVRTKHKPIVYLLSTIMMLSAMILFFQALGQDVTYPYIHPMSDHPVALLGPMNALRMTLAWGDNLVHALTTQSLYSVDENPLKPIVDHPINNFFNGIRGYVLLFGYTLVGIYILQNRMKHKDVELLRNILLLLFTGFVFGKYFDSLYLTWAFPFLLVLMKPRANTITALYLVPLLSFGMFYKWAAPIPLTHHIVLFLTPPIIAFITYCVLDTHQIQWSYMMGVFALFRLTEAVPRPHGYAIYYYIVVLLSVPALLLWFREILRIGYTPRKQEPEPEKPEPKMEEPETLDQILDSI